MLEAGCKLRLYIIGCGQGESIVFEYDGHFGLLDSFRHKNSVPPLNLLKSLGAERLEFMGLTHPHKDHYGGLNDVFSCFQGLKGVKEFWRYPALDWQHLYPVLQKRVRKVQSTPLFYKEELEFVEELQEFYRALIAARRGQKSTLIRNFEMGHSRDLASGVKLEIIAPAGRISLDAAQRLADELENNRQKQQDLNDYSFALHIKVGSCSIYLTSDVSNRSWSLCRTYTEWESVIRPQEHVLYKTSHHGSKAGNPSWLLDSVTGRSSNSIVATRYSPSGLPKPDMNVIFSRRGRYYRLSEFPRSHPPTVVEPECLQVDVFEHEMLCQRRSLASLVGAA